MKKPLFKRKKGRFTLKHGIAMFALISLVSSMNPHIAAAEAFVDASFPEAGEREPVKTITVVATAYNSMETQTDASPCITANGHDLCRQYKEVGDGNTIAANFLRIGTQVRFPELFGDKVFVVRDRMNERYGRGRIDIWLPEYDEAVAFGVQRIEMEVF
ncbi:MAG: hypothetical protein AAB932_04755 [Patescibacteria group bacterium]